MDLLLFLARSVEDSLQKLGAALGGETDARD